MKRRIAAWVLAGLAAAAAVAAPSGVAAPAPAASPVPPAATPRPPAGGAPQGGVHLEVDPDRRTITVGDPVTLTVRLIYRKGTRVTSFAPERDLGALTLLERNPEPPREVDLGRIEEVTILKVTAYEIGSQEVPALEVSYVDAAGTEGKARSAPVRFEVTSVLPPGDSDPADIKRPAMMPERGLWPWIVLALAALGAALWLWRRRRRPGAAVAAAAAPVEARPPHEIAYAELERLLSSGLLEQGKVKDFYIELTEIIKHYLAGRFAVDTFERTTSEILEALRAARLPVRTGTAAADLFGSCDLVKFARHDPAPEETRATVERAYRLVDETRPAPPPEPAETQPTAALAGAGSAPAARSGGGAVR